MIAVLITANFFLRKDNKKGLVKGLIAYKTRQNVVRVTTKWLRVICENMKRRRIVLSQVTRQTTQTKMTQGCAK